MNPESLNSLIRSRRSVFPKDYTGEKVDDSVIRQLLENANWAPTHKLTEPWRFKVFCEEGLKSFAEKQAKNYYDKNFGSDKYLDKKYQKLLTSPLKCSHLISIGMHLVQEGSVPEVEETSAVACAVQNILLSAHAYGLGGYWSTGGLTNVDSAKPFFDLEEDDKLLGFIYLGVIDKNPGIGKRRPIENKVSWCKI
jgi:nitroreductase